MLDFVSFIEAVEYIDGEGGGNTPPVIPTLERFASNRQRFPTQMGSAIVTGTQFMACSLVFFTPSYEQTEPRICIPNFYIDQTGASSPETSPLNGRTIEGAAIEVAGVKTPFTFNGESSFVFTDQPYVWSDPIPGVTLPADSSFKIIIADQVAIGDFRVAGYRPNNGSGDRYTYGSTSQAAFLTAGTPGTPTSGVYTMGPCCILAKGAVAAGADVVLGLGDSLWFGLNEDTRASDARGNYGFMSRGLDSLSNGRVAFGNFSVPGTRLSNLADTAGEFAIRKQILADMGYPFDVIISNMGTNAVGAGWPTLRDQLDSAASFSKSLGNRRVIWLTINPRTGDSGNNGYSTVASQTVIDVNTYPTGERWLLNEYIKSVPTNIDAVIDMTPYWVDATAKDKFKSMGRESTLTADVSSGTTITVTGVPPIVGDQIIIGAGASGFINREVVGVTGTDPYTVTLRTAVTGGTKTAGAIVRATPTVDGLHPTTALHIEASVGIIEGKAVLRPRRSAKGYVFDGNSITRGAGLADAVTQSYPSQVAYLTGLTAVNLGLDEATLEDQLDTYESRDVGQYFDADTCDTLVLQGFGNDIMDFGASLADMQGRVQAYAVKARNSGYYFVPSTILPQTGQSDSDTTIIGNYNAWLRSNWKSFADGMIENAGISLLQDPTQLAFYSDGNHLTYSGCGLVAASSIRETQAELPRVLAPIVRTYGDGVGSITADQTTGYKVFEAKNARLLAILTGESSAANTSPPAWSSVSLDVTGQTFTKIAEEAAVEGAGPSNIYAIEVWELEAPPTGDITVRAVLNPTPTGPSASNMFLVLLPGAGEMEASAETAAVTDATSISANVTTESDEATLIAVAGNGNGTFMAAGNSSKPLMARIHPGSSGTFTGLAWRDVPSAGLAAQEWTQSPAFNRAAAVTMSFPRL